MIGFTFCGLYGDAVQEDGTVLSTVTHADCKNAEVNDVRFNGTVAVKMVGSSGIHAGCLRTTAEQGHHLNNIEHHVVNYMMDPINITAILKLIEKERKIVADQEAIEQAVLDKIAEEEAAAAEAARVAELKAAADAKAAAEALAEAEAAAAE